MSPAERGPQAAEAPADILRARIESGEARIGVLGLGYVGLPLALAFVERGFSVLGFDVDTAKIEQLARGESYIAHLDSERLARAVAANRFAATADPARLAEPDALLICVPTPLTPQREPDMRYIESTARSITARLRPGQLVILESTTYPGTTDELLRPILESGGLRAGEDFFLAFSPEREDPGNPRWSTSTIPKVVGGLDERSAALAEALYRAAGIETVRVSSARAAEATKLTENIFRAVNIALVNELKVIYERMGIDVWEVLDAAETKPFGFMRFNPGPGWGGHCQDGEEFLFVRRGGGLQAMRMRELTGGRSRRIADVDVVPLVDVEVLSFDLDRHETCFRQATHLFRRWVPRRVRIVTPEGRRLTVSDGHPLIVEGAEEVTVTRADSLGAARPVLALGAPSAGLSAIDLVESLGLEAERIRVRPRSGTWLEAWPSIRAVVRRHGVERKDVRRSGSVPLAASLELDRTGRSPFLRSELQLLTGNGAAQSSMPWIVELDADFARLIGYYLSEGCLTFDRSWRTRWVFGSQEIELIDDVIGILTRLGIRWSLHPMRRWRATQIRVSSNLFGRLLKDVLGCGTRSEEMRVPPFLLAGPEEIRRNVLAGLLNGDGSVDARSAPRTYKKGRRAVVSYFTSSPRLLQEALLLLHSLGYTPTIQRGGKELRLYGMEALGRIRPLLRGLKGERLEDVLSGATRRPPPRAVRANGHYASVAPPRVEELGSGWVYSIEVPGTQTYVTSYGLVSHNCIPIDPFYLSWKAREHGISTRFIELAGEINTTMPKHVVEHIADALNESGKPVRGSRILILGVAYKPDVADDRESPSYVLMDLLRARGAEVHYHDPHVPEIQPTREHPQWAGLPSVPWNRDTIASYDLVVIATAHAGIDYRQLGEWARCIVDTRNAMRGIDLPAGRLYKA